MLRVSNLSKSYADRVLFSGLSFNIDDKDRIALIGPNGSGKTTLLDILAGRTLPDSGEIVRQKGLTIGYLTQEITPSSEKVLLDDMLDASPRVTELRERIGEVQQMLAGGDHSDKLLKELGALQNAYEAAGGYSIEHESKIILSGLGFRIPDFTRPLNNFSGGWLMRSSLAKLLLLRPDLLLLDEPTNHLDLEACIWFEKYLSGYQGAVVVTSHDRAFLNRAVSRVLAIEPDGVIQHRGNYDQYVIARQQDLEMKESTAARQEREIAREMEFVNRFRAKATKASQVQSRLKRIEKIQKVFIPRTTKRIHFTFPEPPRSGKEVISLSHIRKSYGDNAVYGDLNFVLERTDRVALVGPNGAGKTTLLRILAGALSFESGERKLGHNVVPGYYAQYLLELLNPGHSVIAELQQAAPKETDQALRRVLGGFLFSGDDTLKPVSVLSGGEKARVALAKLLMQPSNVLLMDEPTNHLDIASREMLADALNDYTGTICLVTHDRTLIQQVANKIVEISAGRLAIFPGDYESYEAHREAAEQFLAEAAAKERASLASVMNAAQAGRPLPPGHTRRAQRAALRRTCQECAAAVEKVEGRLAEAEEEVSRLERSLANPEEYADHTELAGAGQRYNALKDEIKALTDEWEELSLASEKANRDFEEFVAQNDA